MTFVSPLSLALLLPWAALVFWMLMSRRQGTAVPFLNLWRGAETAPPRAVKPKLTFPPLAILCALLALLLAILGAARPRITMVPYTEGPEITVIIDRGISMTARGQREPRWKEAVQALRNPLQSRFGMGRIRLILLPEGKVIDADRTNWAFYASDSEPAPVDTRSMLPGIVSRELSRTAGLVFALTDQQLPADPRLIVVPPLTASSNVGIVSAGAGDSSTQQVMVRLRSDSDEKSAHVQVAGVAQWVELPPRGEERNYFIDLDHVQPSIAIELLQPDQQPLDNHATLTQQSAWPTLEARGALPAEVRRMIDSYSKIRRDSTESGSRVIVTSDAAAGDRPSVQLAPATQPIEAIAPTVEDHPITQHIDWNHAISEAVAASPPGPGWHPIVSVADRALVAIKQDRNRQVWVGFTSATWPRTTDFVVFWTNVFDWAGSGAEGFRFEGIPAVPMPQPAKAEWVQMLRSLPRSHLAGQDLSSLLLCAAVALVVLSLLSWGQRV